MWELILAQNRVVQSFFLQSIIFSKVVVVVDIFGVSVVVIVDAKSPFHPELLILDTVVSWVCGT